MFGYSLIKDSKYREMVHEIVDLKGDRKKQERKIVDLEETLARQADDGHKGYCRYCEHGLKVQWGGSYWSGPFTTYRCALEAPCENFKVAQTTEAKHD